MVKSSHKKVKVHVACQKYSCEISYWIIIEVKLHTKDQNIITHDKKKKTLYVTKLDFTAYYKLQKLCTEQMCDLSFLNLEYNIIGILMWCSQNLFHNDFTLRVSWQYVFPYVQ